MNKNKNDLSVHDRHLLEQIGQSFELAEMQFVRMEPYVEDGFCIVPPVTAEVIEDVAANRKQVFMHQSSSKVKS